MLTEITKNCKSKTKLIENELILATVIVLVAIIGFGLGRLSKIEERKTPITIDNLAAYVATDTPGALATEKVTNGGKTLVASKNGTKYHYVWCSGASTIKEENKVYFNTKEEAEAAGYKPASNCKGL
jgi:hypothetical protein